MVPVSELVAAELLSLLPAAALDGLARQATRHAYAAGDVLFYEGDPGDRMHVLRSGAVDVVRTSPGVHLARCEPGDVFGELAVITGEPRSATAIAAAPSVTVSVSRAALDRTFDEHPGSMRTLLAGVALSLTRVKEDLARHNRVLEQRVRDRTEEVRATHIEVLRRLGAAVEQRDDETGEHVLRMSRMAAALARRSGIGEETSEMLLRAAPLHDIGKIGIPDRILRKPGRLTCEERALMQTHTVLGARLLSDSRSPVVRMAESIARSHHERWDAGGYPDGLRGEAIPLVARVCAIADVFDALLSERPYKSAWGRAAALAEIERGSGGAFEPRLVAVFMAHCDEILAATSGAAAPDPSPCPVADVPAFVAGPGLLGRA
jgi:putative two-component system response regulator